MKQKNSANKKSFIDSDHWKNKLSNHHQIGGIETSIIDNGHGKGNRIAWINTGSGLRFKVIIDRAMDIANASYNQYNLSWLSHMGVNPPNPAAIQGNAACLNSFMGGLLTTCGLTHTGNAESDEYGIRGMHGRISHIPASVDSVIQPDLKDNRLEMSLTGTMLEASTFGPHLELKRTILAKLGRPSLKIHDEVTNLGNALAPHMILYHFNFGWPLVDEGAEISWEGNWQAADDESKKIFNNKNDFKRCSSPLKEHKDKENNQATAFIDIDSDKNDECICGITNPKIGLSATLKFRKNQLPWLANWQHWGKNEYVTALEPCNLPPVGQSKARKRGALAQLEVGETKVYDIKLTVDNISN